MNRYILKSFSPRKKASRPGCKRLHLFHQQHRCRTVFNILFVNVYIIRSRPFVKMRKIGTIGRAHFINRTHVRIQIEELAWLRFVHPVVVSFIPVQPFFLENFCLHAKMRGNSFNIFCCIGRAHYFAAISTTEATNLCPHFFLCFIENLMQDFRRIFFNPADKISEGFTVQIKFLF